VSAGTLVLNCSTTNAAPTQKKQPSLTKKKRPHFQTHKCSWNEEKFGHESRRGPKPEQPCWRGLAAIYCYDMFRTVVSSHSQSAETRKLEDVITKPLPNNGRHHVSSLTALFRLSGVMSHVTYMFTWYCRGRHFWLHYSGLQVLGCTDRHMDTLTQTARWSHKPPLFVSFNKENMLKHAIN
jgi:hypothetical protein